MTRDPLPPTLAERLTALVTALCHAIGLQVRVRGVTNWMLNEAWIQVRRRGVRLVRLLERFRAGTLPKRRVRAKLVEAGREKAAGTARRARVRLPAKLMVRQFEASSYRAQLVQLMAEPEMAGLVAASPQAERTLRGLCRLLCLDTLPDYLARPPRPRAPRKPRAPRVRPPRPKPLREKDYAPIGYRPPYSKPRRRRRGG